MSNFSINNSQIVSPVPVVVRGCQSGCRPASVCKPVEAIRSAPPQGGVVNNTGGVDVLGLLIAMIGLLATFFSQLVNKCADKKDKPAQDVAPSLSQSVSQVIREPVMPKPPTLAPEPAAKIPGLSSKWRGAKPDNIWSGFRQGPDGNCVTVSAIKAAMHRFGQSPTDIFREVVKTNDGYHVLMRDGFRLTLTDRELIEGAWGSKFIGRDKGMLRDAQFLFAASAKRAQMENNDETAGRSYRAAIRSLNDGEDELGPGEGLLRLGLMPHMRRVPVQDLARGQVGMVNRTGHSVAVIDGREEMWGRRSSAPTHGDAIALI